MKLNEHRELWNKIRNFEMDDPCASVRFSDKLAYTNGWSAAFTRRAIDEYKKFIFLCRISPSGASPSEIVDEVWHLHLTYTHNYWKEFCGKTLEKEIHHVPSQGGPAEKEKHRNWYNSTLELYRQVFNEDPPSDIWPQNDSVELKPLLPELAEVDYKEAYKKYLFVLFIPFLFPFFFGKFQPFKLNGPQFLVFYSFLFIAVIIFMVLAYRRKKQIVMQLVDQRYDGKANIFQVTRFVYGRNKAIQTAIVDLVDLEILVAEKRGRFTFYPSRYGFRNDKTNPIIGNLLRNYNVTFDLPLKDVVDNYNDDLSYHPQLAAVYKAIMKRDFYRFIVPALFCVIGLLRVNQGIGNDRPVEYLSAILIVAFFVLIVFANALSGKSMFQSVFKSKYQQGYLGCCEQSPRVAQFVFLGFASLAGMYAFANLENTFRYYASGAGMVTNSACGSSGCGSSCGGGCGGGCGGCGGGD